MGKKSTQIVLQTILSLDIAKVSILLKGFLILEPHFSILEDTDSGLDIDALKTLAKGVNSTRSKQKSFLVITN